MEKGGTIGTLARAEGVNVETIRFYQRRGLMEAPDRPLRGVRRYGQEARARLRFIRAAKAMGFTLAQTADLLEVRRAPSCQAGRALAARQLEAIETRMAELGVLRGELRAWIASCDANAEEDVCPPLSTLETARTG